MSINILELELVEGTNEFIIANLSLNKKAFNSFNSGNLRLASLYDLKKCLESCTDLSKEGSLLKEFKDFSFQELNGKYKVLKVIEAMGINSVKNGELVFYNDKELKRLINKLKLKLNNDIYESFKKENLFYSMPLGK